MSIVFPLLLIATDAFLGKLLAQKRIYTQYIPFVIILLGYLTLRYASHSVQPGGDYSINLVHFLPNFFGNTFGYVGYFLSGEVLLPIYTMLRINAKQYVAVISILLAFICIFVLVYLYKRTKNIRVANNVWLYGVVFTFISLIPFIGLGNITGRYAYLASIGFIIAICSFLYFVKKRSGIVIVCIFSAVLIVASSSLVLQEFEQWKIASGITETTLKILHQNYPKLEPGYRLVFINVPIKYHNAWVFPVGLKDGIWFIYRDDSIRVYQVNSYDDSRNLIKNDIYGVTRFVFDQYGNLSQVEL
jgi:hypothetical protein